MDLYYATTNTGKLQSLQREFEGSPVHVRQRFLDTPEPQSLCVQEVAQAKVTAAYAGLEQPVVALDAGFSLDAFPGFPGALVKPILETLGLDGILRFVHDGNRTCRFQECLAFLDETSAEPRYFLGDVPGTLATEERGTIQDHLWSKLGLIFIPDGQTKTLAEMTYDEHLAWRRESREQTSPARQFARWFLEHKL